MSYGGLWPRRSRRVTGSRVGADLWCRPSPTWKPMRGVTFYLRARGCFHPCSSWDRFGCTGDWTATPGFVRGMAAAAGHAANALRTCSRPARMARRVHLLESIDLQEDLAQRPGSHARHHRRGRLDNVVPVLLTREYCVSGPMRRTPRSRGRDTSDSSPATASLRRSWRRSSIDNSETLNPRPVRSSLDHSARSGANGAEPGPTQLNTFTYAARRDSRETSCRTIREIPGPVGALEMLWTCRPARSSRGGLCASAADERRSMPRSWCSRAARHSRGWWCVVMRFTFVAWGQCRPMG